MENRFDLYDLPEGHAERFQEKLTVRLARQHRRKLVFRFMIRWLCPVFVVVILVSSVANVLGIITM